MLRAILAFVATATLTLQAADLGIFEGSTDIGSPSVPGKVAFANDAYTIHGGGSNMWFNAEPAWVAPSWLSVPGPAGRSVTPLRPAPSRRSRPIP